MFQPCFLRGGLPLAAALLAAVSVFYLRCPPARFPELAGQYFCALCLWSLALLVITWFVGCAANPDNWDDD